MVDEHPFQQLFETFGRYPAAHAEEVNRRACEALGQALSAPLDHPGRHILLKAPRAGHGKTHLLSRVQHQLSATHEFIPVHAAGGTRIDAATVTDDALRRLARTLPAAGGLCVLDLVTRRLFAEALQPLVKSGEVPCQDREGALAALRMRPVETFDFHHPNAVTAHWARENFEVLGPRLSFELSQRVGLPPREVAFWVEALFHFASAPIEQPGRAMALAQAALAAPAGEGEAMERLAALLGLLSLLTRVVLVADELEGFSTEEGAALRLAAFFAALRQSVERLDVVLSVNQDVWETGFLPRLSGGLADRLAEIEIELEPLSREEMVALLDSRAPGLGGRVLEHVNLGAGERHARGLLRAAGAAWLRAARGCQQPATTDADPPAERSQDREPPANPSRDGADEPAAPPAERPAPVELEARPPQDPPHSSAVAEVSGPAGESDDPPAPVAEPEAAQPDESSSAPASLERDMPERPAPDPEPEIRDWATPQSASPTTGEERHAAGPPPEEASVRREKPAPAAPRAETDRVDDLLRQFRERYGRGSL